MFPVGGNFVYPANYLNESSNNAHEDLGSSKPHNPVDSFKHGKPPCL